MALCTMPAVTGELALPRRAAQPKQHLPANTTIAFWTAGDDIGMVLSPQCFHNLNLHEDIFNHSNIHFWEYMQPGYDALGFISCTGAVLREGP